MAEPTPSIPPVGPHDRSTPVAGAVPPPGLSYRGAAVWACIAIGAWATATALAPWLAPRIQDLADRVEGAVGLELVPQEMDR